jgi:transcriptional regulator with XRE-family HTH domain
MAKVVGIQKAVDASQSSAAYKKTSWMGGLDKNELSRPGGILIAMLLARANELGHQLQEMATHLNVTYGYISQLRNGLRKTIHISDEFATACALYLNVPRLQVLLASGKVKPEDIYERPHEVAMSIPHAIEAIAQDPKFGALMPPDVRNLSYETQFFIVTLFEAARDVRLVPGKHSPDEMARYIAELEKEREKLSKEMASKKAANGN